MNVLAQDCAFEYSQMPGIHASPQELEHPFNQTTLYAYMAQGHPARKIFKLDS